jgi:hypothetical protein
MTVRDQTGQVDDASRSGGQLADGFALEIAESEHFDQFVNPLPNGIFRLEHLRQMQRGGQSAAHAHPTLERNGERLAHSQFGEQPGILEGAAEAGAGSTVG